MRLMILVYVVLGTRLLLAQDQPLVDTDWKEQVSSEELELVELVSRMYEQYDRHYSEAEKIKDSAEQARFYMEQDPGHEFIPQLLNFEEQHRGTTVGLMALRKIVHLAAGGGSAETPAYHGRRKAMERCQHYLSNPLLLEMMRSLSSGQHDPEILTFLRRCSEDKEVSAVVRDFCQYFFAEYLLQTRDEYEFYNRRLEELRNGAEPNYFFEREQLEKTLVLYPEETVIQQYVQAAVSILQTLENSKLPHREPVIKRIEPHGTLVELDLEKTQAARLLTAKAAGLLFKENHLRPSKPAPKLAVRLVTDQNWTLKEQRGKVTLVQFSFKGCGPCEAMYPYLKQIQETYPEKVSILTVMCDETIEPSREYRESGRISWGVHWDGYRGPLSTKWHVTGFPSLYIINPEGKFVSPRVRNELIQPIVEELLAMESE